MEFANRFNPTFTNEFLGLPSKYNTVLNKEAERFDCYNPMFERRGTEYPAMWNRNFDRSCYEYPTMWNRYNTVDRSGFEYPMWNRFNTTDRFDRYGYECPMWNRPGYEYPTMWNRVNTIERPALNWEREMWCNNNTLCNTTYRPSHEAEYLTLRNPIRCYDNETRGLWLCFDLRGFRAEEVNVTFDRKERCITVEACHEVKDNKEHAVIRKYSRKFVLPEYMKSCDLAKVELKCFFGADGFFYVEGLLPVMNFDSWPAPNVYPYYGCWTADRNQCWENRPYHGRSCDWNNGPHNIRLVACKYL